MKRLSTQKTTFIVVCLSIPVVMLLAFVIYPIVDLFLMSFTDWNGMTPDRNFISLDNYVAAFTASPNLWLSLRNNMVYFVTHLAVIPIELAIAVMLNSKFFGAKFFKTTTFLPYILNGVAIAYTFSYFLSPINGGLNFILTTLGLETFIQKWLSDPGVVNWVLASVSIWRYAGYHIILFIAALQSIPKDIIEAATVDGANPFQIFRYVQLPSIRLVIDFVLFTNVAGSLQVFDLPFVMTAGGPGYASSTFTVYTINMAFTYQNFGMAATMAMLMIILIIVVYLIEQLVLSVLRKGA